MIVDPCFWILILLLFLLVLLLWMFWWFIRRPSAGSVTIYDETVGFFECDGGAGVLLGPSFGPDRNVVVTVTNLGSCLVRINSAQLGRILEAPVGPFRDLGAGPQPQPGTPVANILPFKKGDTISYTCVQDVQTDPGCKFKIVIKTV